MSQIIQEFYREFESQNPNHTHRATHQGLWCGAIDATIYQTLTGAWSGLVPHGQTRPKDIDSSWHPCAFDSINQGILDHEVESVVAFLPPIDPQTWPQWLTHWVSRLQAHQGRFYCVTFGPLTLASIAPAATMCWPFLDMHDLGDAIAASGLHGCLMTSQLLGFQYQTPGKLQQDLDHLAPFLTSNSAPVFRESVLEWAQSQWGAGATVELEIELLCGQGGTDLTANAQTVPLEQVTKRLR